MTRERVGPLKGKGGNLCLKPEEVYKVPDDYQGAIRVGYVGHVDIKNEKVLGLLNTIQMDKSPFSQMESIL